MNKKEQLKSMLQYLLPRDVLLAGQYLAMHDYPNLKEIIDSNVVIIQKMVDKEQADSAVLENVKQLQICMDEFIEQYNIDIPYVDFEDIENE